MALVLANVGVMVSRPAAIGVKASRAGAALATGASAISGFGAPFLYLFLFFAYSRLSELVVPRLHLPMVTAVLAALFGIANGGVTRVLRSPAGLLMLAFTAWLVISTPLSYWKGGSTQLLVFGWGKSLMLFLTIVALIDTIKQCRLAMHVVAFSVLFVALVCLKLGISVEGRLALPFGFLENPNDLAQLLLLGLPFWLLVSMGKSTVPFRRIIAGVWIIPILVVIAQTGSRSAVVALAVLGLVIFRNFSLANKAKLAVVGLLAATLGLVFLSDELKNRYVIFLGGPDSEAEAGNVFDGSTLQAVASSEQRMALLIDSLKVTAKHPIFGVGPGQFQSYSAGQAGDDQKKAMWKETHCAYTQVSSEAGLPALFFYVGALLYCIKRTSSIYRSTRGDPQLGEISSTAYALLLSLVSYAATSMFSSVAYKIFFPTLAGLCVAFFSAVTAEMKARQVVSTSSGASAPDPAPYSRTGVLRTSARA